MPQVRLGIRNFTEKDIDPCARTFAAAYDADLILNWLLRQDSRRLESIARAARDLAMVPFKHMGYTYTTTDFRGVAVWLPLPGKNVSTDDEWREARPVLNAVCGRRALRSERFLRAMENKHPDEPHYYLVGIGVLPNTRGRASVPRSSVTSPGSWAMSGCPPTSKPTPNLASHSMSATGSRSLRNCG